MLQNDSLKCLRFQQENVCVYVCIYNTHAKYISHKDTKAEYVRICLANNDQIWLVQKQETRMLQGAELYHIGFISK